MLRNLRRSGDYYLCPNGCQLLMLGAAALFGQAKVEYIGGTASQIPVGASGAITVSDSHYFAFYSRKSNVRVAYDKVNLLEYGPDGRPKAGSGDHHFACISAGEEAKAFSHRRLYRRRRQAAGAGVPVDKNDIRATLASLEARTGQRVTYQDEEARKAGRG